MVVEQLLAGRRQVVVLIVQMVSEQVYVWIVMAVRAWAEGQVVMLQAEIPASKAHLQAHLAATASLE